MKQRLLICLLVAHLLPVCSVAAAWDCHWWSMAVMQDGDERPIFFLYDAVEDTTVNGVGYFRIEDISYLRGRESDYPIKLQYGYRMADKKICIYDFDNHKETVGFDFNLSVGDHFTTFNGMLWEVEAVRDTMVNVSFRGRGDSVSKRLLCVRTVDGTMTDQWLEDFGSFSNHFMIRSMGNVLLSHTLWMEYGEGEYLAREISADPFYAHASRWMENDEDVGDGVEEHDTFSMFGYKDGTLSLVNEMVTFGHRFCSCFYRDGDDLYRIDINEMEPFMACPLSLKIDSFEFGGVPAPASGAYTLHVGNNAYSTGVRPAIASPSHTQHHLYDMQGRLLSGKPARGVYIEDGKKYRVK